MHFSCNYTQYQYIYETLKSCLYVSVQYVCACVCARSHMGDAENKRWWVCVQASTGVCLNQNVFFFNQSSAELLARPNKDKWANVRGGGGTVRWVWSGDRVYCSPENLPKATHSHTDILPDTH